FPTSAASSYNLSDCATATATLLNISSGVSMRFPLSSFARYLFSNTLTAFSVSFTLSTPYYHIVYHSFFDILYIVSHKKILSIYLAQFSNDFLHFIIGKINGFSKLNFAVIV